MRSPDVVYRNDKAISCTKACMRSVNALQKRSDPSSLRHQDDTPFNDGTHFNNRAFLVIDISPPVVILYCAIDN